MAGKAVASGERRERAFDSRCSLRTHILVRCSVPNWEEYHPPPAVFVGVRNKELRAYVTWKNIRKNGGRGFRGCARSRPLPPPFFVTAHSKGLTGAHFWNCAF